MNPKYKNNDDLSKGGRVQVEFDCLKKNQLQITPEEFSACLQLYKKIAATKTELRDSYREQFYFQFSTSFDGIEQIDALYDGYPRSVALMHLIFNAYKNKLLNFKRVAFVGSHCGAEIYTYLDFLSNPEVLITSFEENKSFCEFQKMINTSYGINNVDIICSSAENQNFSSEQFDLIIAHGLLYMVLDPINVMKKLYFSLKVGGKLSFEIVTGVHTDYPVLAYFGNGSGWGDTFNFSPTFISKYMTHGLGAKSCEMIEWYPDKNRALYLIEK